MGHTYSSLAMHCVFSTKGRAPLIAEPIRARLWDYMGGLARTEIGTSLRIGGTEDHAHALLLLRTDVSAAEAMRKLKALSSKWVHETFPGSVDFAWQSGYGAFSVSHDRIEAVIGYIDQQEEHHRKVTFEEEFIGFLKRHRIAYDPKYVLD